MPRITAAVAVSATIAELTKEGNKVAKTGELPSGRHAEKGYDVVSFNSGMRYAMQKISTALKQFEKGSFTMPEPSSAGKAAPVAKRAAKATPGGVKKTTRGRTAADKGQPVTPSQKAKASKVKKSDGSPANITDIEEARRAVAAATKTASATKKVVRR